MRGWLEMKMFGEESARYTRTYLSSDNRKTRRHRHQQRQLQLQLFVHLERMLLLLLNPRIHRARRPAAVATVRTAYSLLALSA
jgi:hypothetical protein